MIRILQTFITATVIPEAPARDDRLGAGDREQSFELLQRSMAAELLAFFSVSRRRIPGLEPEDLAQMTLVRVYRSMETFRHESGVRTWVLKIAVNVWTNALRDRGAGKRSATEEVSLDAGRDHEKGTWQIDLPDPGDDPQQRLLVEEQVQLLWEAIGTLPVKMRRCMILRHRDQLSIREIATILKVGESTVKSQLLEGKRRLGPLLRKRLGISDPPEPVGNAP